MLLSELFSTLALGELNQHQIGNTGVIGEKDYPKVISHLNLALTAVHTKFPLRSEEVTIQQFEEYTEYLLDIKHAQSDTSPSINPKWIVDTEGNPFQNDVLRIEAAFNEAGEEIPLNDEYNPYSWYTPTPRTIQIPYPNAENISVIMYRADHPRIDVNTTEPENVEVEIPLSLIEAITAFIAKRIYVSVGNQSSAALSSYYSAQYERICAEVERRNILQSSDSESNIKFHNGGWV